MAGLYLAAGGSSRMGMRKLDAEWADGGRLGGAALRTLMDCGLPKVCAVVRPDDPLMWIPEGSLEGEAVMGAPSPLTVIPCADAGRGMSHSIKCGLRALEEWGADAVLVLLADQPFITGEWLRGLIRVFGEAADPDYAASGMGEVIMPPAILSRRMCRDAVQLLHGDYGAGGLLSSGRYRGRVTWVEEPDRLLLDVDTPEDLQRARKLAGVG